MEQSQALTTFDFHGNEFRVQVIDGEFWFAITDACKILEIASVGTATSRLDPDGICLAHTVDSLGRKQEISFASEPNLYRLIFRSDKPQAKEFQDKVFNEILPAIRKYGYYGALPERDRERVLSLITEARAELTRMRRAIVQPTRRPSHLLPESLEGRVRYHITHFTERKHVGPSLTDLQNYLKNYSREEIAEVLDELVKRGELEVERTPHTVRYTFRPVHTLQISQQSMI